MQRRVVVFSTACARMGTLAALIIFPFAQPILHASERSPDLSAFVGDTITALSLASAAIECSADPAAAEFGNESTHRLAILSLQKAKSTIWRYTLSDGEFVQLASRELDDAFAKMIRHHRQMLGIVDEVRRARISGASQERLLRLTNQIHRWQEEVSDVRDQVLHATVVATHALSAHPDPATRGNLLLTREQREHALATIDSFFPEATIALQDHHATATTAAAMIRQALSDLPAYDEPARPI